MNEEEKTGLHAPEGTQDGDGISVSLEDMARPIMEAFQDAQEQQTPDAVEEKPAEQGDPWDNGQFQARVNELVQAELHKARAAWAQEIAPLQDLYFERQADELVSSGKIPDRVLALEYARMKGMAGGEAPAADPSDAPSRDEMGRFKAKEAPDAVPDDVRARAQVLFDQAKQIHEQSGLDMMALYNSDPGLKRRILGGEMDFKDAALLLLARQGGKKHVPSATGSPNHVKAQRGFENMSADELDAFNRRLSAGAVFDTRK